MNRRELDVDYLIALGGLLKSAQQQSALGRLQGIGQHDGSIAGQGGDFRELRPYRFGDDPRQIDWRVSARKGEPYFRERYQGFSRKLTIVLDWRRSMFFGTKGGLKADLAVEVAAIILWILEREQQSARFLLVSEDDEYQVDIKGVAQLIDVFEHLGRRYADLLSRPLFKASRHWSESIEEACIVISDFHDMDDALWQLVAAKKQQHSMTFISIADYVEHIMIDGSYSYQSGSVRGVVPKHTCALYDDIQGRALATNIVLQDMNYQMPFTVRLNHIRRILKG